VNLGPRLLTELVGTFLFMTVISLSGAAGPLAPVAIGLALTAMVYMGGHISGAHYNPAVSFGLFLRRAMDARAMVAYWAVQLLGGALAFAAGYLISGHTPGIHPGAGASLLQALTAEVVFTTALVLVILNVAVTPATAGNQYYGSAIGVIVAAGAFTVGPVSGAAFNPAVGFGATTVAALSGHGGWSDLWLYFVGPLAGGSLAAGVHYLQIQAAARPAPKR
jgi:aquaporin Z